MNANVCLSWAVDPALDWLAGLEVEPSDAARVLLVAIAQQESGWFSRRQMPQGPARGLWQMEPETVKLIMLRPTSGPIAQTLLREAMIGQTPRSAYEAITHHDVVAACFARLLLLADRHQLPETQAAAWLCYRRVWRPGRPRPESWPASWASATAACASAPFRWSELERVQ